MGDTIRQVLLRHGESFVVTSRELGSNTDNQFADHYSYSALSYFLLIKPIITLFSTILIVALFPVCLVLVFPMPVYLRALRRWGKWQAGIAMGNL